MLGSNKEYREILQKELENFEYRSDYQHQFGEISIDVPMVYSDATSAMFFMVVKRDAAIKLIKNQRVHPVSIFKNYTLLAINVFEYRESAVGAFHEFTFSVPVRVGQSKGLPVLPLIFDQRFANFGFYVFQLGASNLAGRRHIEEIWGYPTYKNDLDISISRENQRINCSIREDGNNILSISEKMPNLSKLKLQKKKFSTFFMHDDELKRVQLETFLFEKTWLGKRDYSMKLGSHQVADLIKTLNPGLKVATVYYPYAVEIAGRVLKH